MIKINEKGQSLVEALIALGVATIVVSAMAVASITAVNNSDFSKYQNLATDYAQQGIEILRQQSQTNWNAFKSQAPVSPGSSYCLDQGSSTLVPLASRPAGCGKNISGQNGAGFFVRQVMLMTTTVVYATQSYANSACNNGTVQATVSVAWTDGKCSSSTAYCHNVTLESCFTNHNNVSG